MRVLPPSPSRRSSRIALLAVLLSTGVLAAGCGGGDGSSDASASASASPSADLPTGNVEVPSGVELTEAGAGLDFGKPAVVAYEPSTAKSSVLSLTVTQVRTGRIRDLAAYQLDARTKKSTPYYVDYTARNVGTGDLAGAAVPLYAVDADDSLVQPSSFTSAFTACPSTPLPKKFAKGAKTTGCLVYLLPDRGKLTGVSFRPVQEFAPITWTGDVEAPAKAASKG